MEIPKPDIPSLNLAQALQGHEVTANGSTDKLHIDLENGTQEALAMVGQAEWRASVNPVANNEFWLTGWVKTIMQSECSRCLEAVNVPIEARFEWLMHYKPNIKIPRLDYGAAGEEEIVFGDPDFNLSPWLAETISEAMPLNVLHDKNCKGLCSQCGTNLNTLAKNTCAKNQIDCPQLGKTKNNSPLAGLKDLLGE